MDERNDIPMTEDEIALAREGEALIKAEVARVQAPQALRERIEADRARAAKLPFWRRHRAAVFGGATAALALAVAVVAIQGGSGGEEPTLAKVGAATTRSATEPAPASLGGNPPVLDQSVGAIEFPDWEDKFGVKAVGLREDEVSGREVTTVLYRDGDGGRFGYAIVDGAPLDDTPPGREVTRDGKTYHVAEGGGSTIVTWIQQGHTCVIASSDQLPATTLVDLAASRNV